MYILYVCKNEKVDQENTLDQLFILYVKLSGFVFGKLKSGR